MSSTNEAYSVHPTYSLSYVISITHIHDVSQDFLFLLNLSPYQFLLRDNSKICALLSLCPHWQRGVQHTPPRMSYLNTYNRKIHKKLLNEKHHLKQNSDISSYEMESTDLMPLQRTFWSILGRKTHTETDIFGLTHEATESNFQPT